MRARFRLLFSALIAAVVLAALPALAAPGDADRTAARWFAEGQKAFGAGDFPRAGEAFEAAYKAAPHHAPLWNAARSWQRAGEDVRAANLYARYLREAPPDAPDRDQATTAQKELSAKLGRIEPHLAAAQHPKVDGKNVDAPVVYVAPGEHVVEGDDSEGVIRKVVRVDAGQLVAVTIARSPKVEPPRPPPTGEEKSRGLSPWWTVAGGALTAIAGGVTVAFGSDTVSKKHAFLTDRSQPNLDRAFSAQSRTNVMLVTTGGLALVTTVVAVFFTDWRGKNDQPRVGVAR